MRAVAQRVSEASVWVDGLCVGAIERGLLVYLGAAKGDGEDDVDLMTHRLAVLRIFPDSEGKMSASVTDIGGSVLVVPQFTLLGDVRRGRRPSFDDAAPPEIAETLYESVIAALRAQSLPVETGRFRATMDVRCRVDGPVTILIDSRKQF